MDENIKMIETILKSIKDMPVGWAIRLASI
jgi:hypothetical protein